MSEFYADSGLLDIGSLYEKYYVLVRDIMGYKAYVDKYKDSLREYSGFGIERQMNNLDRCSEQLRKFIEEVDLEFIVIRDIASEIRNCEKKASGIIGGQSSFDDSKMRPYHKGGNVHRLPPWSNIPDGAIDVIGNYGGLDKFMKKLYDMIISSVLPHSGSGGRSPSSFTEDILKKFYGNVKITQTGIGLVKKLSDLMGKKLTPFEKLGGILGDVNNLLGGVSIFKYCTNLYDRVSDLKIDLSDIFGIAKDSCSAFTSFAKVLETACDVKFTADSVDKVADTLTLCGDVKWGDVMPWVTLGETVISTGSGWYNKYQEYAADGEVTVGEWCRTACYGSLEGLNVLIGELKVVGTALGIVDCASDTDYSELITNSIFNSIDYESKKVGDMMCNMIRTDPDFYQKYKNASDFERHLIYYSLLAKDVGKNAADAARTGWDNLCNFAGESYNFISDKAGEFAGNVSNAVDSFKNTVSGWFGW